MSSSLMRTGEAIMGDKGPLSKAHTLRSQRTANTNKLDESRISRDTFNEQFKGRDQKDFINEANKIMRERMKNKGSTINSKSRLKSVILNDTKEICLKNYLIDLLKEKRTDINEKERNITKALRESENRLDIDYKDFVDFVEETKRKQKKEEEELARLKALHEEKDNLCKKEMSDNKKLNEDLERTIKIICLLKSYGSFVHKVLGLPFVFDSIPEVDSRERNFEVLADLILKNYEQIKSGSRPNILNDESLLILKFTEFEEKVIKILETKQIVDKEFTAIQKSYEDELKELQRREKDCLEEEIRISAENNQMIAANKKLKTQRSSEVEQYLNYIIELGIETGNLKDKFKGKRNIIDCLNFTKETLDVLAEKERLINGYINEIEMIEVVGDKKLIHDIEIDRKKANKRDKQLMIKQKQDQIDNMKRQRAVERAQRVVIKGRKVPKDYPILKEKKKKKKDDGANEFDDYAMLHYSSDENN